MPSELFGEIARGVSSAPSIRARRQFVVLVSLAAHVVVFAAVLFLSLTGPGLLPAPRSVLAFLDDRRMVRLEDINLPAPTRPATTHSAPALSAPPVSPAAAPVVAPNDISPETDREAAPSVVRPSDLSRIENETGPGSFGLGVGPIERPAAPPAQTPVRLHSGIREPVKLVHVDPVYPVIAQSARVQGVVILEAVIDASGRVDSVQVLRSIALFDRAAVDAVRRWRYSPAMLNGSPVAVIMTITVHFRL